MKNIAIAVTLFLLAGFVAAQAVSANNFYTPQTPEEEIELELYWGNEEMACAAYADTPGFVEKCVVEVRLNLTPNRRWKMIGCYGEITYDFVSGGASHKGTQGYFAPVAMPENGWVMSELVRHEVFFPKARAAQNTKLKWLQCRTIDPEKRY